MREERDRLAFSQEAFAVLAGVSKRTQYNHEKDFGSPTAAALAVWAELGLNVLYVVTGYREGLPPPPPPTPEEQMLLEQWREASKEARRVALGALVGAALPSRRELPGGGSEHGDLDHPAAAKKKASRKS